MTRIKICGLSRPLDIAAVNRLLPEYIGFVFAKSPRQITRETAAKLKADLRPSIAAVGVFVNDSQDQIVRLVREKIIQLVQLHGDEDDVYIRTLRQKISCPIIKAVRVRSLKDVIASQDLASDFVLYDTYQKGVYGGAGQAFDWSLLKKARKPYFLAGGLTAENVQQALSLCHPYCVDVSSGVEKDGRKDETKMEQWIRSVRNVSGKI